MNYCTENVYSCCATRGINGFYQDPHIHTYFTEEKFKAEIQVYIDQHRHDGKSLIVCTVNSDQTIAEGWLKEMGFVSPNEDWVYRDPTRSHYRTGIKLYTKQVYTPEPVVAPEITVKKPKVIR